MKVQEIEGVKFSAEQFKGYRCRFMIDAQFNNELLQTTIYTDTIDKQQFIDTVISAIESKPNVTSIEITHWATKEQDDRDDEILDEVFG